MSANLGHWWRTTSIGHKLVALLAGVTLLFIIGGVALSRAAQSEKKWLIRQMSNRSNSVVLEATEKLRTRGWLYDGSLQGANLDGANLAGADLTGADLGRVWFMGANLEGVRGLSDEQLVLVDTLRGAKMPDGQRYDGRYRLWADMQMVAAHGVNSDDPAQMANYYGVSVEDYQRGQEWADANLEATREAAIAGAGTELIDRPLEPGAVAVLVAVIFSMAAAYIVYQALPGSFLRNR
jgi:hypothetical protein